MARSAPLTSYVNSVLQVLYYCRPFRDAVMLNIDPYTNSMSPKGRVTSVRPGLTVNE